MSARATKAADRRLKKRLRGLGVWRTDSFSGVGGARVLLRNEQEVGMVDSPELAAEIVRWMNRAAGPPPTSKRKGLDICPFCGASGRKLEMQEGGDNAGMFVRVHCTVCHAEGPTVRGPMVGDCTDAQCRRAEKLWNARSR